MPANFRSPSYAGVSVVVFALAIVAGCYLGFYSPDPGKAPPKLPAETSAEMRHRNAAVAKMLSDSAYEMLNKHCYDEAVRMSTQAINTDPTLAEAHKNLALSLCGQGRCAEALEPAREAVRLRPDFDKAHYVLGKVLTGLGRYADAVAGYKEALRINGQYDKAFYGLGVALDRLNEPAAAAEAMRQAARLKPEQSDYGDRLEFLSRHLSGQPARPPSADFAKDNYAAHRFRNQVRDILYHEGFGPLERSAGEARANKERLPGGFWKLGVIYDGLAEPEAGQSAPEAEWQFHLGKLKSWAERDPSSTTARVALAYAYVRYAWGARGDGRAGSVTPEGWGLFRERLSLAKGVLEQARGARPACPHWYAVMLDVALGQGWDAESHERLFQEAAAYEPTYPQLYAVRAFYLLPRWHGRAGEWARFAAESADRLGGSEGSVIYYKVVMAVARSSEGEVRRGSFFTQAGLSWERFRRGLAETESIYGVSAHETNRACLMAAAVRDKELARALFKRIGDNWDTNVWSGQEEFESYRSWARSEP